MLTRGYEWAAKHGEPSNAPPKKYRLQPPCCKVVQAKTKYDYTCGHPWEPKFELPWGNPITGRAWDKPRPDTGSYLGGDFDDGVGVGGPGRAGGGGGNEEEGGGG